MNTQDLQKIISDNGPDFTPEEVQRVTHHCNQFMKLADFCKEHQIKKFAYGDTGERDKIGSLVVDTLRIYFDVEYSSGAIFFLSDTPDPDKAEREAEREEEAQLEFLVAVNRLGDNEARV